MAEIKIEQKKRFGRGYRRPCHCCIACIFPGIS
jgi:hypothetical protein